MKRTFVYGVAFALSLSACKRGSEADPKVALDDSISVEGKKKLAALTGFNLREEAEMLGYYWAWYDGGDIEGRWEIKSDSPLDLVRDIKRTAIQEGWISPRGWEPKGQYGQGWIEDKVGVGGEGATLEFVWEAYTTAPGGSLYILYEAYD